MRNLIAAGLVVLVACGGARAKPAYPQTFASEEQDAWLHEHCDSRGLVSTDDDAAYNAEMTAHRANFGELVGRRGATVDVKAFMCSALPPWYTTDVSDGPSVM